MKLSLECAMRFAHKGFIEALTNNDNPKFTYLGEDPKANLLCYLKPIAMMLILLVLWLKR